SPGASVVARRCRGGGRYASAYPGEVATGSPKRICADQSRIARPVMPCRPQSGREDDPMKPDVLALGDFPPGMMAALAERFTEHHFIPYPVRATAPPPQVAGRIGAFATEGTGAASRELIAR